MLFWVVFPISLLAAAAIGTFVIWFDLTKVGGCWISLGLAGLLCYWSWSRSWISERKARRFSEWHNEGKCLSCGHTLDEDQDRCPECGTKSDPDSRRVWR